MSTPPRCGGSGVQTPDILRLRKGSKSMDFEYPAGLASSASRWLFDGLGQACRADYHMSKPMSIAIWGRVSVESNSNGIAALKATSLGAAKDRIRDRRFSRVLCERVQWCPQSLVQTNGLTDKLAVSLPNQNLSDPVFPSMPFLSFVDRFRRHWLESPLVIRPGHTLVLEAFYQLQGAALERRANICSRARQCTYQGLR